MQKPSAQAGTFDTFSIMLILYFALGAFFFGGGLITLTNALANRASSGNPHSKR